MSSLNHAKSQQKEHKIMCVVDICEGYCCKHIFESMAKKLRKHVELTPNSDGTFTCIHSDKEKGTCLIYKERPLVCRQWFCESALLGYMQNASKYFKNPIVNEYAKR